MVNPNISEKLALNIVKKFQPITIWRLSKKMDISYSSTFRLIQKMENKELITIEKKETKTVNLIRIKEDTNDRKGI